MLPRTARAMKIGQVAQQAGVGVDTVRCYERRGALARAARTLSGYRAFTAADVERILFVKALQTLGFTLDDIIALLNAVDAGTARCASERVRFEAELARVDAQLRELRSVRRRLSRTLQQCEDGACQVLPAAPQRPRAGRA
ncbi:MAG: MerR family transcriptional regulator [Myxococcaceae bacterium]|nr:MAG: MerR family transcriptional regulator [Myxococcaceae bacterium]